MVFDVGHYSFRAGFAGEDCPKTDVPTTIGYINDVVEPNVKMEIDMLEQNGGNESSSRRYLFDTPAIKSPRSNLELTSFLKDGMSMIIRFFN